MIPRGLCPEVVHFNPARNSSFKSIGLGNLYLTYEIPSGATQSHDHNSALVPDRIFKPFIRAITYG